MWKYVKIIFFLVLNNFFKAFFIEKKHFNMSRKLYKNKAVLETAAGR